MATLPTLSVCMIVRDEEAALPRCLDSVQGVASELIVVDTGSTDRTVEIARSYNAQVHSIDWCDDFAAARNESLRYAAGDWILCLDADEWLDAQARASIQALLRKPQCMAYYLEFHSTVEGGAAGSEVRTLHPRLFRNHCGIRFKGRIHEEIVDSVHRAGGVLAASGIIVRHSGYQPDIFQARRKAERNIRILLQDIAERPAFGMNHFYLGENYALQQQWEPAVAAYREAIAVGNIPGRNLAIVYQNLGTALLHQGDVRSAMRAEADALRLDPGLRTPHLIAAQAAFQNGNWDKVIFELTGLLDKVEHAGPEQQPALLQHAIPVAVVKHLLGQAYLRSRNFPLAIETYREMRAQHPEVIEGICGLAAGYTGESRFDEAVQLLQVALETHGERADLLTAWGSVAAARRNWEKAADLFKRAAMLAPGDYSIRAALIEPLFQLNRHQDVVDLCVQLPQQYLVPAAAVILAQSCYFTGRLADTRMLLDQLRHIPETACEALCLSGSLHENEGTGRAMDYFRQAADTPGGKASLYFLCGSKLLAAGESEHAIRAFETAHRLDPQAWEPQYNMAVAYIKAENWPAAAECFESLLRQRPDDNIKRKLAGVYAKMGETTKTARLLMELSGV